MKKNKKTIDIVSVAKPRKTNILILVSLAVIFGISGGIVGELVARAYILEDAYNLPFFGKMYVANDRNLVIRGAKKIVVEQNAKIAETISSSENSIVGVFKKREFKKALSKKEKNNFDLNKYYDLSKEIGQGMSLSSDGWIITNIFWGTLNKSTILKNYVVITKDNKIYEIDKIAKDVSSPFSFLHAKGAGDFPVMQFANRDEVKNGELVLALNWKKESFLSYINSVKGEEDIMKSSDVFFDKIVLADKPGDGFSGTPVFNLSGSVLGFLNKDKEIEPIWHFTPAIDSLFKDSEIKRPSLGLNYIDLVYLVPAGIFDNNYEEGALIYQEAGGAAILKGGVAETAGLKDGDIITFVDGIKIDKYSNLTYIIQNYSVGQKVKIEFLRENKKMYLEFELGKIE